MQSTRNRYMEIEIIMDIVFSPSLSYLKTAVGSETAAG